MSSNPIDPGAPPVGNPPPNPFPPKQPPPQPAADEQEPDAVGVDASDAATEAEQDEAEPA
ncbi:MAG: hypothetical protein ACLQVL_36830 [Terriglobia bacterium]